MRDYDGHKMWIHYKLEGRAGERGAVGESLRCGSFANLILIKEIACEIRQSLALHLPGHQFLLNHSAGRTESATSS